MLTRLPSNLRPTNRECVHLVRLVTSGHMTKMVAIPFDPPKSQSSRKVHDYVF